MAWVWHLTLVMCLPAGPYASPSEQTPGQGPIYVQPYLVSWGVRPTGVRQEYRLWSTVYSMVDAFLDCPAIPVAVLCVPIAVMLYIIKVMMRPYAAFLGCCFHKLTSNPCLYTRWLPCVIRCDTQYFHS